MGSVAATCRLKYRLSSCGAWAQLLHGMWNLHRPDIELMSPEQAGEFLFISPPDKIPSELRIEIQQIFHPATLSYIFIYLFSCYLCIINVTLSLLRNFLNDSILPVLLAYQLQHFFFYYFSDCFRFYSLTFRSIKKKCRFIKRNLPSKAIIVY